MELEELKSTWKDMSERLDKKEIFEKRLIKETISTRARNIVGKEHEKVFRTTILYLLIAFGLMPFLYYKGIMSLASIVAMDVYILIALGISLYIRSYIIGIDLSRPVKDISPRILRYKKLNRTNNYVQYVLAVAIVISYYLLNNASLTAYLLFLVTLLVLAYPCYLQWKRHNADIDQLEDDIKALEEL